MDSMGSGNRQDQLWGISMVAGTGCRGTGVESLGE